LITQKHRKRKGAIMMGRENHTKERQDSLISSLFRFFYQCSLLSIATWKQIYSMREIHSSGVWKGTSKILNES
jgi:hypothetical protein